MLAIQKAKDIRHLTYKLRKQISLIKRIRNEILNTCETNGIEEEESFDIAESMALSINMLEKQRRRMDAIANELVDKETANA